MNKQPDTSLDGHERPINVLEIIGNADKGGMENYLEHFIRHLPPKQFRLTCICPYESPFTDLLRQLGVYEVFITAIEDNPLWHSIQLTNEVARLHHIDVLHAHMPKAHVLAGLVGCLSNKPVVATVHGMEITAQELGIARAVGSHLITNNEEAYAQALALGIPSPKVDLVRNGVDTAVFKPGNNSILRSQLGLSDDIPLIGFVGRLELEKGPDLFLRAAEYIHSFKPEVHFAIVGDGSMAEQLKLYCKRMHFENNVHFIDWQINTSMLYSSLDILTHTSRSDGTSLVLLEAMACECPTVGLGVGGVLEIIENNRTGLLAKNWEGIGEQIIKLLENPARLAEIGKAARIRVHEQFNVASNTKRVTDILRKNVQPPLNGQKYNDSHLRKMATKSQLAAD